MHTTRSRFLFGLSSRLIGVGLIWLGDGSDHALAKGLVILGVILLVFGTAVLRFLLFAGQSKRRQSSRT